VVTAVRGWIFIIGLKHVRLKPLKHPGLGVFHGLFHRLFQGCFMDVSGGVSCHVSKDVA
jgi:hypothetical protein